MHPNTLDVTKALSLRTVLRLSSMPVTALLYCVGLNYAYVQWVSPVWSDLGFTYSAPNKALVIAGYVLAATQSIMCPVRIRRPSQVAYWITFFMVFIPGLFVPLYIQLVGSLKLLLLQLSLTAGMLPIAISCRMPLPTLRSWTLSPRAFWTILGALFLLGNAFLLITFRGNLQFASIEDIYSVRYQASQVLEQHPAAGYVTQFLGNVLNPFLIAYGLVSRRKRAVALGTLGQVMIYSTAAAKSIIISPLVIFIFYFTLRRDPGNWTTRMGLIFAGLLLALTTLAIGAEHGAIFNLASVVLMRTFEMPGMLLGQYQYFFENNPHTHLGHVAGFNVIAANPYTSSLGIEVGRFFGVISEGGKNGDVVSNASFFAMDGIAGFGLPGIPLMGFVCAAVFWMLDGCAKKLPLEFSVSGLAMIIVSMTNVSLFSTLLGNGLIAWILLFLFIPKRHFRTGLKV
jgi:hypothetical protein